MVAKTKLQFDPGTKLSGKGMEYLPESIGK
jgi:hypothetical protein